MSDIAIRTEGLSKRYQLGDKERYYALRDTLTRMVRSPLSFFRREKGEYIYALKDVNLEVKHGEVLGLIGRNGAGKTTLLKLLSQITRPTSGWADIYGRVGSLLEVGTGFHPELTGRENIYLSGAILGMTKKEISRKFDEIVAFSELEKFLDTAVKHYSSGMYVRLAFAVAAHLEPEILMVDEVLAVGDVRFQKKCLGKMSDVARGGRTVLLVSHNTGAILQLCSRCVLLEGGMTKIVGTTSAVVGRYLEEAIPAGGMLALDSNRMPRADAIVTECWIADEEGNPIPSVDVQRPFCVAVGVLVRKNTGDLDVGIQLRNASQVLLFTSNYRQSANGNGSLETGEHRFLIPIQGNFLAPGSYTVSLATHRPNVEIIDRHEDVVRFDVEETGSDMWQYKGANTGTILVRLPWRRVQN